MFLMDGNLYEFNENLKKSNEPIHKNCVQFYINDVPHSTPEICVITKKKELYFYKWVERTNIWEDFAISNLNEFPNSVGWSGSVLVFSFLKKKYLPRLHPKQKKSYNKY